MGFINLSMLAIVAVLYIAKVESFMPTQKLSRASSSISMAGGRVPLVPYYPNKATGSKDYQWMDIYNALGRERWEQTEITEFMIFNKKNYAIQYSTRRASPLLKSYHISMRKQNIEESRQLTTFQQAITTY